jgi:transposase
MHKNKKYIVKLSDEERTALKEVTRKGKSTAYRIKHAYILLQADSKTQKKSDEDIAKNLGCHLNTVKEVRKRYVEEGLELALERKSAEDPPRSKKLDGRQEAKLIALSCSKPPKGRERWTLQLLADELVTLAVVDDISAETVRTTLKKTS